MTSNFRFPWLAATVFLALAAFVHLVFGFEASSAGLVLANVAGALDLKQLVDGIKSGFDSFQKDIRGELVELRRDVERVESKGNLAGLVGGNSGPGASTNGPQIVKATPAERKAFAQYLRTGEKAHALDAKAISVGVPGEGGLAVPTWFDQEVHSMVIQAAPVLNLVRRRKVRNFPTRHIVTDRGMASGWVTETGARPGTNTPGVIAVDPPHGEWYCNPQLTQWAIDDIAFDAVKWIQREIARELASSQQSSVVFGNGGGTQPRGILASPNSTASDSAGTRPHGTLQYFPTGVAGALPGTTSATIDLLLTVVHGLHQFYRARGTWLMGTETLAALRRMKDVDGRPILLDSLINRQPSTLLGYPVIECEDMPVPAAGSLSIAFGDFDSGYVLDEHEAGLRVVPDPYSNKPYVGFYSTMRYGGAVLDSNAIKLVKFAAS
jgi:HK97 family phage major capsid protein